jgi:ATP-binding cassette subfamily C exporter for protease/lipase
MSKTKAARGELRSVIGKFRTVFQAVGAFSFAINLLLLVPAIYMLQIYDRVLSSRNEVTLYMLTLIVVGLYMLEAALELVRSKVLIRAGAALDMQLGPRLLEASFERYLHNRGGNPGQALIDLANIRQFLTGKALFAFFDAPWSPIYILVIFLLNPWLGVFAACATTGLLALACLNERLTGSLLDEAGEAASAANNYATSNLRNAEVIEAMGMLPNLRRRWFGRQARFLVLQASASERAATLSAGTRLARLVMQSGILGLGALLVIDGQMTAGGMIAASILLGRALSPVDLAIGTWRGLVNARAAYKRLEELLSSFPAREQAVTLPSPQGAVIAENLVVAAAGSREPILKGVSFRVAAGSITAVIGPSASGKSTLARALVGVWRPVNGAIRLDGAEIHKWNKEHLGPWIGYLPQDVELFEGSVGENIARFGALDSERIVDAARKTGVHEMILRLPQGYDTPIGEGGTALSAGQRQRVALARALYGEPALIVLDEPNSNLDEAGDAALIAALRAMKQEKRTVFIMTHRVNILSVVDAVMVLGWGAIRAHGPRDALIKSINTVSQLAPQAA